MPAICMNYSIEKGVGLDNLEIESCLIFIFLFFPLKMVKNSLLLFLKYG